MRLSFGVVQSAYSAQGPYTLDPINYESDWTGGVTPSGWTVNTTPPYADGTYTANGVHIAVGEAAFQATYSITSRPIGAFTFIEAYYVDGTNVSSLLASNLINNSPENYVTQFILAPDETNDPSVPYMRSADTWLNRSNEVFMGTVPTGQIVVTALTLDSAGVLTKYMLTAEGHVMKEVINPVTQPFLPFVETVDSFTIGIDYIGGTEADLRLMNTYVGIDEELTESAIKTIATGWGWTESAYSSGAAEQTNASWTSSLPATWNLVPSGGILTDTPTYAAGGTYNSTGVTGLSSAVGFTQDTAKVYTDSISLVLKINFAGASTDEFYLDFGVGPYISNYIEWFQDALNTIALGAYFQDSGGDGFLNPVGLTGDFYAGLVMDFANQTYALYLIESGETTQTLTGSLSLPDFIVAYPHVQIYGTDGTPGDLKLVKTYVGLDEALSQAAIESVASGWGWTP